MPTNRPEQPAGTMAKLTDTGVGEVKRLQDIKSLECRLRVGESQIRFHDFGDTGEITGVYNRREAHR